MGTITISVDAGAGGTASKTFTVTNANLQRLVAFAKSMGVALPEGSQTITNQQAMERWMRWVMDMSRDHIMARERQEAVVADFDATAP